jgi:hypothetical protein
VLSFGGCSDFTFSSTFIASHFLLGLGEWTGLKDFFVGDTC